MTSLERLALQVVVGLTLCVLAWFWHVHAVSVARQAGDTAGYSRAITAGKAQYAADLAAALKTERETRAKQDADDKRAADERTEREKTLSAAQDRVRTGVDRLRCPATIYPVHAGTAPAAGPVAGGSAVDGPGADLVPAVAVDVLGYAAASQGLVRKYERLTDRYEACRAMNNSGVAGSVAP